MGLPVVAITLLTILGVLTPHQKQFRVWRRSWEESIKAQEDALEALLSEPPPFALRSTVPARKACRHDNKVDVEDLYYKKVAEWCPDCDTTIYCN